MITGSLFAPQELWSTRLSDGATVSVGLVWAEPEPMVTVYFRPNPGAVQQYARSFKLSRWQEVTKNINDLIAEHTNG